MSPDIVAVDEFKAGAFLMAAAVVPARTAPEVGRLLRAACRPGQRALHFRRDARHREAELLDIVRQTVDLGVTFEIADGSALRTTEVVKRQRCLAQIVETRTTSSHLLIDRDESEEQRDRRSLMGARQRIEHEITFAHVHRYDEPLVWLPDIVVGCFGRGGRLRVRVRPHVAVVHVL